MATTYSEETSITGISMNLNDIDVRKTTLVTKTDDSTDPATVSTFTETADYSVKDASDTSALVEGDQDFSAIAAPYFAALPASEYWMLRSQNPRL